MAIPAQGMTVTWGGTFLLEVREVNIDQDRGLPLQRDGTWTLQLGTVPLRDSLPPISLRASTGSVSSWCLPGGLGPLRVLPQ